MLASHGFRCVVPVVVIGLLSLTHGTRAQQWQLPGPRIGPTPVPVMPVRPAPPQTASTEGAPRATGNAQRCALGELCIGPEVSLGAIHPFGIGVQARYGRRFGAGVDYQFMPRFGLSSARAGWSLLTFEGRFYPFGGALFLAAGLGYERFSAVRAAGTSQGRLEITGTLSVPCLKLGIGLMGRDGFVMGIDLGFNVPFGSTSLDFALAGEAAASYAADPSYQRELDALTEPIEDAASAAVKLIAFVPQFNLLRIGYLF